MGNETFISASGLRPASAFVVIGFVITAVAFQVLRVSFAREADQPTRLRSEERSEPSYSIADANGQALARFVPSVCLKMSPRSAWQVHTPELMAERLSEVLGGQIDSDTLFQRFFPDAKFGVIEVDWILSPRQAERINGWILSGAGTGKGALEGIWTEPSADRSSAKERLFWRPKALLARRQREALGARSALRWASKLADGLACCLCEPEEALVFVDLEDRAKEKIRREVWKALCPTAETCPVRDISPRAMVALRNELESQSVLPWQMRIVYDRKRVYPAGKHELFGSWGFTGPGETSARPRAGLELLCDQVLASGRWPVPKPIPEIYVWRSDRTVRGRRANGYVSFVPASTPPCVETSLDLSLQRFVRGALDELMQTHEPAIAMALVVDVQSGDVLAVEGVEAYEIQPFTPLFHQFTVGSTFKLVTMAVALEEGVVDSAERLDVGQGTFRIHNREGEPTVRVIHEAIGSPKGMIRARECVAFSSNAGMSQIGLRVEDERFHDYLSKLGYGRRPQAGLGSERAGMVPPLPWSYHWSHASIGFGHEISATLWQHATALASILRGGVHRPLRIVRSLELDGVRHPSWTEEGTRIFSDRTCNEVREMMRLGASLGTGDGVRLLFEKHLAAWIGRDPSDLDFEFGTKTGTAQKVPTELCLHVELCERERWERIGVSDSIQRRSDLKLLRKPHAECYTSSICVFGRRPWDNHELMVLVVADEPRGEKRFGSQVAGPTAEKILSEALGLTAGGEPPADEEVGGFGISTLAHSNAASRPWRVVPSLSEERLQEGEEHPW